jgi:hypothetical protein
MLSAALAMFGPRDYAVDACLLELEPIRIPKR